MGLAADLAAGVVQGGQAGSGRRCNFELRSVSARVEMEIKQVQSVLSRSSVKLDQSQGREGERERERGREGGRDGERERARERERERERERGREEEGERERERGRESEREREREGGSIPSLHFNYSRSPYQKDYLACANGENSVTTNTVSTL